MRSLPFPSTTTLTLRGGQRSAEKRNSLFHPNQGTSNLPRTKSVVSKKYAPLSLHQPVAFNLNKIRTKASLLWCCFCDFFFIIENFFGFFPFLAKTRCQQTKQPSLCLSTTRAVFGHGFWCLDRLGRQRHLTQCSSPNAQPRLSRSLATSNVLEPPRNLWQRPSHCRNLRQRSAITDGHYIPAAMPWHSWQLVSFQASPMSTGWRNSNPSRLLSFTVLPSPWAIIRWQALQSCVMVLPSAL